MYCFCRRIVARGRAGAGCGVARGRGAGAGVGGGVGRPRAGRARPRARCGSFRPARARPARPLAPPGRDVGDVLQEATLCIPAPVLAPPAAPRLAPACTCSRVPVAWRRRCEARAVLVRGVWQQQASAAECSSSSLAPQRQQRHSTCPIAVRHAAMWALWCSWHV